MAPSRRLAAAGLAALLLSLALVAVAIRERPRLERAVRERIQREAAQRGLVAQVESARIGPWPPLLLRGVRVEKPGAFSFEAETVAVRLRLRGRGLLGRLRLAVGPAVATGPQGLSLAMEPMEWDVVQTADARGLALAAPSRGLAVTWAPSPAGGRAHVEAADVPAGRLFHLRRDALPVLDAGVLRGRADLVRTGSATELDLDLSGHGVRVASLSSGGSLFDPPTFGQPTDIELRLSGSWRPHDGLLDVPRWEGRVGGAAVSGSLILSGVPDDPALDLSLDVERVDFARLFETSGLDQPGVVAVGTPAPPRDLGSASLSARASGRLADPGSFTVTQKLDFTPPRSIPPVFLRLRGDFTLEVFPEGRPRRTLVVSPVSPDFIPIGEVPGLFLRTLLIAEDAGFWGHRGIDLSELPSAILTNWSRGGAARGASTITQQLAKNLFLSRDRNIGRKLQELSLALLLEATLSKPRILEIYLNVIEWGPDLYGLRPAARHYFGCEPADLTPAQTAFLVALIPGPVKYQRSFADGTPSPAFRQLVDRLLVKLRSVDALSEEAYEAARAEALHVGASPTDAADADAGAGTSTFDPSPATR